MKKIFILLFTLASFTGFSQSKRLWLFYADDFYKKENYISAIEYYLKTLDDTSVFKEAVVPYEARVVNQKLPKTDVQVDSTKKVPLYDYIMHQVGMCYKNTFDYHHAATHFKITSEKGTYPEDLYHYAYALMNLKQYNEAIESFEKYITSDSVNTLLTKSAQKCMTGCYFAMNPESEKTEQKVKMSDTAIFNKGTASFAAMFWGNNKKLIFASAREGGVLVDAEKQDSEYLCDMYWTEMEDSTWGPVHNFGRPVNTSLHEAAGSFTADDVMYFTRWSDVDKHLTHIYLARMMNGKWFEALKLDSAVNYPGYKSMHPFVSMDGTQLYYSSNRPGGKGGFDLWTVQLDEFGNPVGKPSNLGDAINTPFDEVTPFFHLLSSTLYFSSNGHSGMGGLDVFKSAYNIDEEVYAIPTNVGSPINSSKDDAYMIWDRFLKKGYFSSDREDCPTGHCYDIYEVDNGPITISIEGFVYDAATDEPIPNALVTFKDVKGEMDPFFVSTDETGFYSQPLEREWELFIKAQKVKYLADAASVNTYGITESTVVQQDFFLKTVPVGDVEIPGIEYDYDKATLRPKSKEILDKLYDFLALNDNLSVEINSHTDCRGNDAYNMKLSQARAQSCVDYLISKGIARTRLVPKGYGETTPIPGHECATIEALKDTDHDKFEEMHQKNRRTAFRILKQEEVGGPN